MGIAYLEKYGLALNQRVTPVKGPSYQNTNSNVLNMVELNSPPMLLLRFILIAVALSGPVILHAAESASPLSPAALGEMAQVEGEIDRIEAQTLERLAAPPGNQVQQIELVCTEN